MESEEYFITLEMFASDMECRVALSRKFPNETLSRNPGASHMSVVLGQEQELSQELDAQILGPYQ